MQYTNAVRKLACGMLMLAIIPCGRIVKAASDGGEGEYRVHFTLPTEPFVKLGDSILYTTETDCRLPGGDWTPSPPSTITVLDPNGVQYQGEDSVTVTTTKTGDYTATASCNADPETTDDAITVTVLHTDIVQTDEEACIHGNASTLTLSAGDAGHVDSFDGGGGWTWTVNPAEGLDCSDDGYKTFTYTPAQSEPGNYTITAVADLLSRCNDQCGVTVVKVDLDVEGVADEDEADAPGALVCVTNGTAGAATRKQITVNKCAPASWDGQVTLLWSAGNVRVYTAPSNGVEVTSGTTFANTALPTNLWVEGIAVSDTAGDVVFRLNPRNVDCPHTATGCDRVVMTILKVEFIEASCPRANNTPQQFEGHKTDFGDPCATNDPGQALVIFHKDARDTNLVVQDFDVTLNAHVLPPSVTADQMNESWAKVDNPDSGSLNRTDTFEVKYQNSKKGGVYRFEFDLGLSGCGKSGANVELPLGGPDVTTYLLSEAQRYEDWLVAIRARVQSVSDSDWVKAAIILGHTKRTVAAMMHREGTYEAGQSPCKRFCPGTITVSQYVFRKDFLGNFLFGFLSSKIKLTLGSAKLAAWVIGEGGDDPDDYAAIDAGYQYGWTSSTDLKQVLENKGVESMQVEVAKRSWPSTDVTAGSEYPTWGATHPGPDPD